MRGTAVVVVVVGLSLPVVAQENDSPTIPVNVCGLVKNPREYHGRVVRVRGQIHPAVIDTPILLSDSTCAGSVRLDIHRRAAAHNEPSDRDFRRYLAELRTVEATVSGRFEMILIRSEEPLFRLTLLRVADVIPGPPLFHPRRRQK